MRGLTLLEVLISIFLTALIISGFYFSFSAILAQEAYVRSEARAIELAEKKLEEIRRIKLANWNDNTFTLTGNFSDIGWTGIIYTVYIPSNHTTLSIVTYTVAVEDTVFGGKCELCTMITRR